MKVLIATFWPLPYNGGLWTFVSQLKKGLEQRGIMVDILSNTPDNTSYRLLNHPSSILKNELEPLLRSAMLCQPLYKSDPSLFRMELEQYCMELSAAQYDLTHYDIIHAQDTIAAKAMNRIKPKNVPLVTSIHGYLSGEYMHSIHELPRNKNFSQHPHLLYYQELERQGYEASNLIITASKWLSSVIKNPFPHLTSKIKHIPYGLNLDAIKGKPQTSSNDNPIILYTGRLERLKGIQDLLKALSLLKMKQRNWECWIVGDGTYKKQLQLQSKQLGLHGQIKFWGNQRDIPSFLQRADIFVLPSLQDNQPYSVIEAAFSGLPVIVSDAGGLPEMITHERNGLLFRKGDSNALYNCLERLIIKPELRKEMGKEAKRAAEENWRVSTMINQYVSVYKELRVAK